MENEVIDTKPQPPMQVTKPGFNIENLRIKLITRCLFGLFVLGGFISFRLIGGFVGFSLLIFVPSIGLIAALVIYSYQKRKQIKQSDSNKKNEQWDFDKKEEVINY